MFGKLFQRTPSHVNFRIAPAALDIQASTSESLLQTALAQGVPFPHNCRAGGCGACKCRLLEGKVKELTDKSYLLSAEELQHNYILACQSIPKSHVVVEVTLDRDRPDHALVETQATIQALKPLTADIMELVLQLDQPMAYSAGQYAQIALPAAAGGDGLVSRSYSFACAQGSAKGTQTLHFYIKQVPGGRFTEWLFKHAATASRLALRGPYGNFYLRPGMQAIVAIAGGSGLAPIKAMLEQALQDKKAARDVLLFLGARSQADLLCLDAIAELQRHWIGRFRFVPVLSDAAADSGWSGRTGFIPAHLQSVVGPDLAAHQAYLCGPPPMIDACMEVLLRAGMDPQAIFFDKFLDSSHLAAA